MFWPARDFPGGNGAQQQRPPACLFLANEPGLPGELWHEWSGAGGLFFFVVFIGEWVQTMECGSNGEREGWGSAKLVVVEK